MLLVYLCLFAVLASAVLLHQKLWVVWCGIVLITRGLRRQVGPHVGRRGVEPRVRDVNNEVLKGVPASLKGLVHAVSPHVPTFGIRGSCVELLETPEEFLESIVERLEKAQSRIYIATLYLGTSKRCARVVDAIDTAMAASPGLTATILVDYGRGQRRENGESVLTLFAGLVRKYGADRVKVCMFMVPLCGATFRHAPATIREVAGVQHMKAFVIDTSTLLTGANLNDDYFTNRQDRYMWIHNTENLSNWAASLIGMLGSFSYQCRLEGPSQDVLSPSFPHGRSHPIYSGPSPSPYHEFSEALVAQLLALLDVPDDIPPESDTYVMPFTQLAAVGLQHESNMLVQSIITSPVGGSLALSSAYPNFTRDISSAMSASGADTIRVVAPAEDANGFHGARGAKAYVPLSYTSFLASFVRSLSRRVSIALWSKPGWTYHGKGLWFQNGTIIGSTNIGHRSTSLDAELSFMILTGSADLDAKLKRELTLLLSDTTETDVVSQHAAQKYVTKAALFIITNVLYPFL